MCIIQGILTMNKRGFEINSNKPLYKVYRKSKIKEC